VPHGCVPVTLRRLDAVSALAVGVPDGGALLVRPDGKPAWLSSALQHQREHEPEQHDALRAVHGDADQSAAVAL